MKLSATFVTTHKTLTKSCTVHGKIFWRTIQVKGIGEKIIATVSAYAQYIFNVSVNIGKENLGEYVAHSLPNLPFFHHQNFPIYQLLYKSSGNALVCFIVFYI